MSKQLTKAHTDWRHLADLAMEGKALTREEALSVLRAGDDELLAIMDMAYRVRRHFYGNKVKLNFIVNAKSGYCPEDCGYCSQSIRSDAPIEKYTMLEKDTLVDGARKAMEMKAGTYCIVASGRGPTKRELAQVVAAVEEIKSTIPLKICACLGILSQEQADQLKKAGVDRYNHNLNTSSDHFSHITSTHTYEDRVHTVNTAKVAGMSPCSGVIIGMGESDEQLVDVAFSLRELDADSIPINFLNSIPGTPLAHLHDLDPRRCLKVLAMFRFVCPSKEIRASGGREVNLRSLQPLALYAANSIFVGDYLTTEGQEATEDHSIIEDLGFEIERCAL